MSLLEVLKSHIDTSCIMLYGSVSDCVISEDLCYREFSVALHDILRECGYDNIVFYDFSRASGKYVFDDESAYYSIYAAKAPYEKKYGGPPNKTASMTKKAEKKKDPTLGGRKFGRQPKVVGTAPVSDPNTPASAAQTDPQEDIPRQQRNLDPAVFYGELQHCMADASIKSAFIFDIYNFLHDQTSRQNVHNILYQWRNPDNIIIFLNPDGKCASVDEPFVQLLNTTELYQYFCTTNDQGTVIYRSDKCFSVRGFEKDEIAYLFQKYRLFKDIQIVEGIEEASDKINYMLHQKKGKEKISFRRFAEMTENYFASGVSRAVDDQFYESVCQVKLSDFVLRPLDQLHQRAGWEKPIEQLVNKLVEICPKKKDESCTAKDLSGRIRWLSERNHKKTFMRGGSLITDRFGGGNNAAEYPNSAQLPHIMLVGNPGTGKTTAARMMGRIFHDVGLLATGHVMQYAAGALQAGFIGQTAARVNHILDDCENGVLFVDEAYSLCEDYGREGNAGTFKQEVVDTLVNAMTDTNRHVLVIFAGYPSSNPNDERDVKSVRGLYKMNPGFERRVKLELVIEDYPPEALKKIYMQNLIKKGYALGADISESQIDTLMLYYYQTRTNSFENGDFAEKLAARCIASAHGRLDNNFICRNDFENDEKYLDTITMDSIKKELEGYPGLGEVGMRIIDESVCLYNNRKQNGIENPGSPKHILLVGKRGTGKTTLAKKICKAWGIAGIMSGRDPVIIENPASCSNHIIVENMKRALFEHTALFIDEAHNSPETIIQDLLSPMTEYKNLTCIFAVYPERKEEFLEKDPGLRDRCDTYEIEDYSPDQLLEIFKAIAKRQHREADNVCIEALKIWFQNAYDTRESDPHYSNARMVENVVEQMEKNTGSPVFHEVDIPDEMQKVISIHRHTRSFDEVMRSFNDYVGWDELRSFLNDINNNIEFEKKHPKAPKQLIGHMLFTGSPGTGKTEAGQLFAEACYALGLVKTSRFCRYGTEDLESGFLGQTREKTKAALKKGVDGVIFIDEAYNLASNSLYGDHDYGKQIVDVLLRFSVEQFGRTIIVLAGYENKMREFLRTNPGLESRFSHAVHFRDFSAKECTEILRRQLEKGYAISDEALVLAESLFEECIRAKPDWGNARDVGSIQRYIVQCYRNRVVACIGDDIVLPEDIKSGFQAWHDNTSVSISSGIRK